MRLSWALVPFLFVGIGASPAFGEGGRGGGAAPRDTVPTGADSAARRDSTRRDSTLRAALLEPPRDTARSALDDLNIQLRSRLETKTERTKNERCRSSQLFNAAFSCSGSFQPAFDFQFNLLTNGSVGDRVHANVDYDTQREFDASNNISLYYQGKGTEALQRLEVGNVSFNLPRSRFITSGIPSGNYGVQAVGRIGTLEVDAIAAQQKGNVVKEQVFLLGGGGGGDGRTRQPLDREIEDYQIEPRRFFFTVDPLAFGARYPNIDILDRQQMAELSAALPDTLRPSRIFLYRLLIGGQPPNPNGPRFELLGAPPTIFGGGQQPYELLRENVDYYVDPSLLWVALVRPLSLANERLVVAYTVRVNGRDTTIARVGGTPDLAYDPRHPQYANLIWDPQVGPNDAAFRREIRSVYRLGGPEIRRGSVDVRIVTGASADQEKPPAGGAETYLQLFGLSQLTSGASFDVENRLWPRPTDPNFAAGTGLGARIIRDNFIVFPSVEPFSRRGLARTSGVPANDTLYRTPSEYLFTQQHPQTVYRIRARYESEVGGDASSIALTSVQIRQGSERITLDGRTLVRGLDYTIDYELGRVLFTRPELLFDRQRRVAVRYEENPLFTSIPTTIYGLTTRLPLRHGELNFTAISQTQRTTFTRPPLGFEPAASLVAGVSGAFAWNVPALSRALRHVLPARDSSGTSRIAVEGELAVSRPRPNAQGQAYVESFEGDGGITVDLNDFNWYYSSQPTAVGRFAARFGASALDLHRATTLAWQNYGVDRFGQPVTFSIEQIDPQTMLAGQGLSSPERLLWMTMYPLRVGGLLDTEGARYQWQVAGTPTGRRWRSIRAPLGATGGGVDLSRVENLEFWALVDTSGVGRSRNPVLVFDFGDVSENSVSFAPETLIVHGAGADSSYTGKQLQGFDTLNTERDSFSRTFNVDRDDNGLPGDVVEKLTVVRDGRTTTLSGFQTCTGGNYTIRRLGDARANCTVHDNRLEEEDLDGDGVLNYPSSQRDGERVRRYIVDLGDRRGYDRVGRCDARVADMNGGVVPQGGTLCWVHFRLPFNAPDDSTNGGPLARRVRALRLTMLSGDGARDDEFISVPIARLALTGAPWVKRAARTVRGVAGETMGTGTVLASLIGTQDSTMSVPYQPPPGVSDAPESRQSALGQQRVQINEHSLRVRATGLAQYDRAEAFYRFPEGQRSFMAYRELRVWARGRGRGWGTPSATERDLQFYIKIGRDANNFYLYRTGANSGATRAAWEPEIRVRFDKFFALRAQLQQAYLRRGADSLACTGADSALIVRSGLPIGTSINRHAACADGYMVYTIDPAVSPPNLAAVEELAVGIVRVGDGSGIDPLLPSDTAEVWVDDIRLGDVVSETGYAGTLGATVQAGDFASVHVDYTRRDPNFRQLAEQPTFATNNDIDVSTTWRLDRLLPHSLGVRIPLTVTHVSSSVDPFFLNRSDVRGAGVADLRAPRASYTTYALSIQRDTPLRGAWLAPLVNHLSATVMYSSAGNRSEFQTGDASHLTVGVDYLITDADAGDSAGKGGLVERAFSVLPNWLPFRPLRDGAVHLTPTQFRLTSALVRDADRRSSYLTPAGGASDPGSVVEALNQVWRSGSTLEFRPLRPVSAHWELTSVRDLRDYPGATGLAAAIDRERVGGLDVGFERERTMQTTIAVTPYLTAWLTPRLDFASTYNLLRDPNARTLIRVDSTPEGLRLPRRLGNTQSATASATLDVPRLAGALGADSGSTWSALAHIVQPIDISVNRSLLSAFDGLPFDPGTGYQLGLGDLAGSRRLFGTLASSAGLTDQFTVSNSLALPFHIVISHRFQRIGSRSWTRRLENAQARIDGTQVVYPDLSLRWTGRFAFLDPVISSVGLGARWVNTRQGALIPSPFAGQPAEQRTSTVESYPLSGTIVWAGGLSTTAGYTTTLRRDSLPGSATTATSNEMNAEIARAFVLPRRWTVGVDNKLRTRFGYQETQTQSYVSNLAVLGHRSRLTDNGRRAFSLSADTDLAENLNFSLQGSRVVTFDRNFNRQFVQTVFSAVFQLQFFSGELR